MNTLFLSSNDKDSVEIAAKVLMSGGTIIYPTETLYGLGGISTDERCYSSIFRIKSRPINKPFPVLVKDINMLMKYAYISEKAKILIEKFWPGPLTLILKSKKNVFPISPHISKLSNNVGFRVSAHSFVKKLFELVDKPIISTSANISGEENLYTFADLKSVFNNKVDLIINSGTISASKGSTIVDCSNNPPKVIREGDIPKYKIYEYI